ncbi:pentapeptide repeat-containing protein [Streptomyces cirratus]
MRLPQDAPCARCSGRRGGIHRLASEREIRKTVLRLIGAHLRDDSPESWQGYDLDFTGAVLDEADFRGARFTGGDIIFIKALFVARDHDQVVFDEVAFADGSYVYFRLAEFRSGTVRFDRTVFSGGWVTFDAARFTGARVNFRDVAFGAERSDSRTRSSPTVLSTSPAPPSRAPSSTSVSTAWRASTSQSLRPASPGHRRSFPYRDVHPPPALRPANSTRRTPAAARYPHRRPALRAGLWIRSCLA